MPHCFLTKRAGISLLSWSFIFWVATQCTLMAQSEQVERKRQAISERQLDADLKLLLNDYYAGKPVRARIVIPANERGVEVVDGQLKIYPLPALTAAVQPGEMVLIKELRFKSKEIEVRFNGEHLSEGPTAEPTALALAPIGPHGSDATVPKAALLAKPTKESKTAKTLPDPRVILRFSRDIETRDLNLQSINRLLEPAVEVTTLTPAATLAPKTEIPPHLSASDRAQQAAEAQGIALAPVTGELVGAAPNLGELVIEFSATGARLYIDGAYSGTAPRTVQLPMGVHTVLIIAAGRGQFEQKFFLPAGKISTIKAEFHPK
jgi:hypothetical protein